MDDWISTCTSTSESPKGALDELICLQSADPSILKTSSPVCQTLEVGELFGYSMHQLSSVRRAIGLQLAAPRFTCVDVFHTN